MKFQNALVALEGGFKVIRESQRNRLNGVCLYMKDGKIYTQQVHPLSNHKVEELSTLSARSICADDWTTKGLE